VYQHESGINYIYSTPFGWIVGSSPIGSGHGGIRVLSSPDQRCPYKLNSAIWSVFKGNQSWEEDKSVQLVCKNAASLTSLSGN